MSLPPNPDRPRSARTGGIDPVSDATGRAYTGDVQQRPPGDAPQPSPVNMTPIPAAPDKRRKETR